MNLSDIFTAVAYKELVRVDLPNAGSNQHELNGVAALKDFFGTEGKISGAINWHYFADDHDPQRETNEFTFYDARARSAKRTRRSEWRFYYKGEFLLQSNVGDLLVFVRSATGRYYGLIFQKDSAWRRAAQELFVLQLRCPDYDVIPEDVLRKQAFEFLRQQILAELELDVVLPVEPNDEELILARFGRQFPTTRDMSAFARSQVVADIASPDETLTMWLEREEQLFRALENVIIGERLSRHFSTVDEFIAYSLSVQNRRKSRMGHALQNHLAELFMIRGLRFTPQARTEANNRPDFIFPSVDKYHDATFNAAMLVMLGVKSTSKDRWRQVLTEADRIPNKHLCTLEPGISTKQTDEMRRQSLTLVVPVGLHPTYSITQQAEIMSIEGFIDFVLAKQKYLQ